MLTNVSFVGQPGQTSVFKFLSHIIKTREEQAPYRFIEDYAFILKVHFRPCLYGEMQISDYGAYVCSACPVKQYSLTKPSAD